ncbi:MAG: hypothetical protein QOE91_1005 [Gaiellaceae bacterium]|nr:hypothetical protein [Gaiellaceae bacterium]
MIRVLVVSAGIASALVLGVGTAGATNECRGLNPCVPVAGPWVIVPVGNSVPRPEVQYVLSCPKGYVVGGLDAELSDRAINVTFIGKTGSPVNPGITTSRTAVFSATYVGSAAGTPSFRPHIGCMPGGGGRRTPTAVSAVVPPGEPTTRRVRTLRVYAGVDQHIAQSCAAGERLIAAYYARGFYISAPPTQRQAKDLVVTRKVSGTRFAASVRSGAALLGVHAVVQISTVCAGGK